MTVTSEEVLVRDSIEKVQLNQDKVAFNLLLEKYYLVSCKYATKFLSNNTFFNLINWYFEEVESYVFLVFLRAIKSYKLDNEQALSFKNYLFQLIRFETIKEIKRYFNWQCIPSTDRYQFITNQCKQEKTSFDVCVEKEIKEKVEEIGQFLKSKKKIYATIWKLKIEELDSEEICRRAKITIEELRNRWQYIKRLVREKYSYEDLPL